MKDIILKLCVYSMPVLCAAALSGCSGTAATFGKEKVQIGIGDWVRDNPVLTENKEVFEKEHSDTEIVPYTYVFSLKTFYDMAENKKLPDLCRVPFTEMNKVIERGYAADMSEELDKADWSMYMNPELKEIVSDSEGHIYGVPYEVYAQGLYINKDLFRQAGLTDEQGNILYPKTLDEMAQYAAQVHERTGKAGFAIPTLDNCGGWHFLNIAWNFGTEFIEKQGDGSYRAVFDTDETAAALQYVKDLKWKYNALPDISDINLEKLRELFVTGEAAMMISAPQSFNPEKYGMLKDDIMLVGVPAGPGGSFAQMGGTAYIAVNDSTPKQIERMLDWIGFVGRGPYMDEYQYTHLENEMKKRRDEGTTIIYRNQLELWLNEEVNRKKQEIREKYCNVDPRDYDEYYKFSGIQIRPEPEVHCQDLYSVLDKCIMQVITDKNADVKALIKNANEEFQSKYL